MIETNRKTETENKKELKSKKSHEGGRRLVDHSLSDAGTGGGEGDLSSLNIPPAPRLEDETVPEFEVCEGEGKGGG